jgi:hypothetical protein
MYKQQILWMTDGPLIVIIKLFLDHLLSYHNDENNLDMHIKILLCIQTLKLKT